jgi:hypothetical protein
MSRTGTLFFMFLVILASCSMLGTGVEGDEGSIAITVSDSMARTLLPPIDMTPVTFDISGTGPGGKTFSQSTPSSSFIASKLVFGTWNVTVSAKNAGGTVIGRGTGTAVVVTGQQTPLAITVAPLPGTGTLDLDVTWTAADVQTPSIDAQLLPSTGSAIPLVFTTGARSAGCLKTGLAAGYYTLTLKLLDNGVLVMGAVEVVRIVTGQTTAGLFDFTQVNKGSGGITVSITPAKGDPIAVTLTGQSATLATGASMTVTAAVPAGVGNVTYVWYVNGESKATGSNASPSFTLGSTLAAGFYRLDVTSFTPDGRRAGAATHSFSVL